jgi:hypothetical protein
VDEAIHVALSADRPWPGMRPYRESDAGFFFGRDAETADLQARVERSMLTLLYGRGGLGKTSLVRAGMAPRLAGHAYLPVYLRPRALLADGSDPVVTTARAIEAAAKAAGVEATAAFDAPSLWELFHRDSFGLWDSSNRLVTAVLVFDQFEEIFQLIDDEPAAAPRVKALLDNIAELVENRLPARLAAMDLPEGEAYRFDIAAKDYRVVLSFREDYLPQVRKLHAIVPAVIENHVRLEPLSGRQALEVVEKAGGSLVDREAARALVAGVGRPAGLLQRLLGPAPAAADTAPDASLANLEVEPSILSVVCFYLNAERRQRGQSTIDVGLVKLKKPGDIFDDYYRKAMAAVDPQVRQFVETHLVTSDGERVLYPVKAVEAERGGLLRAIAPLLDQGILRKEWFAGEQRLEISHDLLLRPIREAAEQVRVLTERRRLRRRLLLGAAATFLTTALLGYFVHDKVQDSYARRVAALEAKLVTLVPLHPDWKDVEEERNIASALIYLENCRSVGSTLVSKLPKWIEAVLPTDEVDPCDPTLFAALGPESIKLSGVDALGRLLGMAVRVGDADHPITAREMRMTAVEYVQLKIDQGPYTPVQLSPLMAALRKTAGGLCAGEYWVRKDKKVKWFEDHGGVPEECN